MSKPKGNHKKHHKSSSNRENNDSEKGAPSVIDENNAVYKMFKVFASELDDKHDRYERIVKLSRDITIESKRIIFALHNTLGKETQQSVFDEINSRLMKLIEENFKNIALELDGRDPYQYHKAYTNGMQEFIEALVFFQYLTRGEIDSWEIINKNFTFKQHDNKVLHFSHYDFILGIADFTGELMRRSICNLGIGNNDDCFKLCQCVRYIYTGFLSTFTPGCKEISRKVYTLKQSLMKMELVCYNLTIRGSEIPKHMLVSVLEQPKNDEDVDEGYF